jgi:hypothetical protein
VAGGPAAFMSYARCGNPGDDAQLSLLRERLEHAVSARTGADFSILADRDGANASAVIEDNDLASNAGGASSIAKDCEPTVSRARNKE